MTRFAVLFAFALALAGPALAAQTVELRPDIVLRSGQVTLGDIFEGAGADEAVVVAGGAPAGSNLVLDAGRLQVFAQAHGLIWSNARGLRRVIARADAAQGRVSLAAERGRPAEVLVYARDFQAGEVVRPEDLVWSRSPAYGVPLDTPQDSTVVIGMAAKRALRAGAAVSLGDVSAPKVIRKDDTVSVAYEADGIKLVLLGKAAGSAAVGEMLDVVNPGSRKVIQAMATGPGAAVVGPQADRLKAALSADPQLIASLR
jgi:flagella basal body P-ring formation protein FlgA